MANQMAKFIDVTRTYIPIDPNSFPESLHFSERDEAESKVPVVPYIGKNFLPTSYGYKSYFGLNQDVGIDALPEMVDRVFVYQNESFSNILIALCDSGIWIKAGDTAGAWSQIKAMPFTRDFDNPVHYEWTAVIISDVLYVYRQGQPKYQKITGIVSAPGIQCDDMTPNFLNVEAQMGIFRAGGRLGFWDSADSISWSNLDDYTDFEPSLETLAGNVTFSMVQGRIVTILAHGQGFIIYATKSITFVEEASETLYQWKPFKILTDVGIAYPQQATIGIPDSTHYAYTPIGLYRIEKASAEIIIPDVTDFLKDAKGPKYLQLLEGRYLFVNILDPEYAEGVAQFSDEDIPPQSIPLPGSNLDLDAAVEDSKTQGSVGYCSIIGGMGNGAYSQPPGSDPSVVWRPIYTAFLASANVPGDNVEWTTTPCSAQDVNTGEPYAMSPGVEDTLQNATSDYTRKTEVAGTDAYVDGKWTIERFVAAQTAIWQRQESAINSLLSQMMGRSKTSTKVTETPNDQTMYSESFCDIGTFVNKFSGGSFGFSGCEFWLTRLVLGAVKLRVKTVHKKVSVFVPAQSNPATLTGWNNSTGTPGGYQPNPSPVGAYNAMVSAQIPDPNDSYKIPPNALGNPINFSSTTGALAGYDHTGGMLWTIWASYQCAPGWTQHDGTCVKAAHYVTTETITAYIVAENEPIAPRVETGFCKLTAWKDIVSGTIMPASDCTAPPSLGNPDGTGNVPSGVSGDGSFCGKPFDPVTIPGTPPIVINWPPQTVVIPGGSFLLQNGSIAPYYPTFEGALVYDTHLKKWGKFVGRYKQLLDYSPINTFTISPIPYDRFGMIGGIVEEGGKLRLFDAYPDDSFITWGKVGYYRLGKTSVEEVHIHMKTRNTGQVEIATSLEGKNLSAGLVVITPYDDTDKVIAYGGYPGSWHNITVRGYYDISYIEYRGFTNGKR
ncbi:MAG: hypothetical protein AB7F19_07425 [Candidatus Babeliales bacterium]